MTSFSGEAVLTQTLPTTKHNPLGRVNEYLSSVKTWGYTAALPNTLNECILVITQSNINFISKTMLNQLRPH